MDEQETIQFLVAENRSLADQLQNERTQTEGYRRLDREHWHGYFKIAMPDAMAFFKHMGKGYGKMGIATAVEWANDMLEAEKDRWENQL